MRVCPPPAVFLQRAVRQNKAMQQQTVEASGAEFRDPPRPPNWVADLVAALFVIGLAFAADPFEEYTLPTVAAVGASAVASVLLPFRRRWPVTILILVIALFTLLSGLDGTLNVGLEVAIAIALFGIGVRRDLKTVVIATVAAVLVSVLAAIPVTGSVFDPRIPQLVFVLAFAGAVGDAARMHRGYIAAIKERAVRAEQTREAEAKRRVTEERLRIARDLHDAVAHEIAVISLNAGVASETLERDVSQARLSLVAVRSAARSVLSEIGVLLELLRTEEASDEEGSAAPSSPQPSLERVDKLVARFGEAGLEVSMRVEGDLGRVPAATGRVAYRVVQEALTNAYKHGGERRAHVLLNVEPDRFEVVVSNPTNSGAHPRGAGRGESPGDVSDGRGFGITGLREQVASVRGTVDTGLVVGGWRVAATLPIPARDPPMPAVNEDERR